MKFIKISFFSSWYCLKTLTLVSFSMSCSNFSRSKSTNLSSFVEEKKPSPFWRILSIFFSKILLTPILPRTHVFISCRVSKLSNFYVVSSTISTIFWNKTWFSLTGHKIKGMFELTSFWWVISYIFLIFNGFFSFELSFYPSLRPSIME